MFAFNSHVHGAQFYNAVEVSQWYGSTTKPRRRAARIGTDCYGCGAGQLFLMEAINNADGDTVIALRGIAAEEPRLFVIGLGQPG